MPTKSESIKLFLLAKTHPDLANLYNLEMECQVNVAQDNGERIGGDYKGRKWHGWTDDLTIWKSFRIPYNAKSKPEYQDTEIKFDLAAHAEGIGMTGWDWKNQISRWVAFDFDSVIHHKSGLSDVELSNIEKEVKEIPWVTIRKSTSGKGLHLYVFLAPVKTKNHTEHAALARAILGKLAALTGYDFNSKIDVCGGNMWIWHRKMQNTDGLRLIKSGTVLKEIPPNWKDHIKVISGTRKKTLPQNIEGTSQQNSFEDLLSRYPKVPLDEEHKALINYLKNSNALWWWDQDQHMLVTHTSHLQDAFESLDLRGYFKTLSTGKEKGNDWNCFLFPMRRGSWSVRRFTQGVQEHESWEQDGAGWTRCYFNRDLDLPTACKALGGIEDPKGGFVFREAEMAIKAAALLGTHLDIDPMLLSREAMLDQHKSGRLVIKIEKKGQDTADKMQGWLPKKNEWTRVCNTFLASPVEPEVGNYDDLIRHITTNGKDDQGWMIKSDGIWCIEPLAHVRVALSSLGFSYKDTASILGSSVFKRWKIVNKPFQPEYPGDREWNKEAAQLKYIPTPDLDHLSYDTWLKILNHCGEGLNEAVSTNSWCRINGILTGADYLKCWIASLFQKPEEPLPYLFFWGVQNCGKSIFHEALALLLTSGVERADIALSSQSGFNAELEYKILCIIEETDLRKNKLAYARIKDWVTSREILMHRKGLTPYSTRNTTHWIQCDNSYTACPITWGDTRVTMIHVKLLDPLEIIPKRKLIGYLEKEAPDFLAEILNLELPESGDRLNIPIIQTEDKMQLEMNSKSELENFIDLFCIQEPGCKIKMSDFYDRFISWLEPNDVYNWSKIRVGREIPPQFIKGRLRQTNHVYIANIWWNDRKIEEKEDGFFGLSDGFLCLKKL